MACPHSKKTVWPDCILLEGKQKEKSEAARARICRATLDALVEFGYQGTSTTRIVQAAGLSRGALQHHYPSKLDVMVGATDYLFARAIESAEAFLLPLDPGELNLEHFAEYLFAEVFSARWFPAVTELMVAARTEEALKARIVPIFERWEQVLDRIFQTAFQTKNRAPELTEQLMLMTRCLLRGLAVREGYQAQPEKTKEMVSIWVQLMATQLQLRQKPAV